MIRLFKIRPVRFHVSYRTWAAFPGDRETWGDMFLTLRIDKPGGLHLREHIATHIGDDIGKVQILSVTRLL